MMALSRCIMFAASVSLLSGCVNRDPNPTAVPAVTTVVTDDAARIRLEVSTDRAEMTTADRLRVRYEVTRPVGLPITLIEPDWSAANWTLTDTTDTAPVALPDGRVSRARTVVLEPFLDGEYAVPPVTLVWAQDGTDSVIASQPLPVPVRSVLSDADDGELAAALPALPPPEQARPARRIPVAVGCGGLIALATAWVLVRRRPRQPAPEPTPLEILRSEAASTSLDPVRTHRALRDLTAQGRLPAQTLHQFERARFDPRASPSEAAEIARHALATLGVAP